MSQPDEEPSYGVVGLQKCQGLLATGSPNPGTSIQELHCSVIKHMSLICTISTTMSQNEQENPR